MKTKKRIRPRLLVLLWVWGILMFIVVDLFRNVEEFDRLRPDWRTYSEMRLAAHKLVGVPIDERRFTARIALPGHAAALGRALREVDREHSFAGLERLARADADPRVRIRALRGLATLFGDDAHDTLTAIARDEGESEKVRAQAARYLGRTGDGALAALDNLVQYAPRRVQKGALLGYAELGTERAARALIDLKAVNALAGIANPAAVPVLAEAARDGKRSRELRAAACHSLSRTRSPRAVEPLMTVLAHKSVHPAVRAAAADALGRLGRREALDVVAGACADWHPAVVKAARLARQRLEHIRVP